MKGRAAPRVDEVDRVVFKFESENTAPGSFAGDANRAQRLGARALPRPHPVTRGRRVPIACNGTPCEARIFDGPARQRLALQVLNIQRNAGRVLIVAKYDAYDEADSDRQGALRGWLCPTRRRKLELEGHELDGFFEFVGVADV